MRYTVWNPGIGNDSGYNSYHLIREEAFSNAIAFADAVQAFWAQTNYCVVIDSETQDWGVYDSSTQAWTGVLHP